MVQCALSGRPSVPAYAFWSVLQAMRMNIGEEVYFITDDQSNLFENSDLVQVIPYAQFEKTTEEFRANYFHITHQPYEVERLCIERWFVIRDIMKERGFERCFCLDSDVLVFNTTSSMAKKFEDVDYTMSQGFSWCTAFINHYAVIEDFCDFVARVFQRDPDVWPLVDDYIQFSKPYTPWQNLCDMTLVYLFSQVTKNKYTWKEEAQEIDGAIIDPVFARPDPGLVMDGDFKKVEWIDDFPYGRWAESGKLVRFDLIHFQGVYAKGLIKETFDRFSPGYQRLIREAAAGGR